MRAALLCLALVACSASQRHTSLAITTATLDAAQVGLVVYDAKHQADITSSCASAVTCTAELAAYRATRDEILGEMKVAYEAVKDAWKFDTDRSVATAVTAAVAIEKAIEGLK